LDSSPPVDGIIRVKFDLSLPYLRVNAKSQL
jgi:hypothetical protein